jgi:hypothetical protein
MVNTGVRGKVHDMLRGTWRRLLCRSTSLFVDEGLTEVVEDFVGSVPDIVRAEVHELDLNDLDLPGLDKLLKGLEPR